MATRGVEWLLRAAALLSAATCVVWVLGVTGTGLIFDTPDPVGSAALAFDLEAAGGSPSIPVEPTEAVFEDVVADDTKVNSSDGYSVPGAFAQFSFSWWVSVYEPSSAQRLAWLALQCLLSLGLAWLWWSLATVVASSRGCDPFTTDNARRIRLWGVALAVGGPAYAVGTWLVQRWMLARSELVGDASIAPLAVTELPWWSVGVGLALLVVAEVWRSGAAMRDDLVGLV